MISPRRLRRVTLGFRGFLPLLAGLLIWELIPGAHGSPFFPAPSEWFTALGEIGIGEIASSLAETLRTLVIGLVLATVLGSAIGIAIGFIRIVRLSLSTTLEFLRALPAPVIIPIAVLALGQSEKMKIFVVVFASIWPILLNAAAASGATQGLLLDVGRTFRLSRTRQIVRVVTPSTFPAIMVGVRVALPIALILTILVEMLGSGGGVGSLLMDAQRQYRSANAFGLLFVVGLFGYLLNAFTDYLASVFLRRWPAGA